MIKTISPQFYSDIAQNEALYYGNYITLSYLDRVFISFWIVITIYLTVKSFKMQWREMKKKKKL